MVAQQTPCLGPITQAGCGALCPDFARGCYGCFGPKELANVRSLAVWATTVLGTSEAEVRRLYHTFNAWAPEFRDATHTPSAP